MVINLLKKVVYKNEGIEKYVIPIYFNVIYDDTCVSYILFEKLKSIIL